MLQKLYKWNGGWWCGCIWIWANHNQVCSNIIAYIDFHLPSYHYNVGYPALSSLLCSDLHIIEWLHVSLVTSVTAGDWLYGLFCNIVCWLYLWKDLPASTRYTFVPVQYLRILHLFVPIAEKKKPQVMWITDPLLCLACTKAMTW